MKNATIEHITTENARLTEKQREAADQLARKIEETDGLPTFRRLDIGRCCCYFKSEIYVKDQREMYINIVVDTDGVYHIFLLHPASRYLILPHIKADSDLTANTFLSASELVDALLLNMLDLISYKPPYMSASISDDIFRMQTVAQDLLRNCTGDEAEDYDKINGAEHLMNAAAIITRIHETQKIDKYFMGV